MKPTKATLFCKIYRNANHDIYEMLLYGSKEGGHIDLHFQHLLFSAIGSLFSVWFSVTIFCIYILEEVNNRLFTILLLYLIFLCIVSFANP
jgi:hypothetical protein